MVQHPDPTRAISVEKFGMQTTMSPDARTSRVRKKVYQRKSKVLVHIYIYTCI